MLNARSKNFLISKSKRVFIQANKLVSVLCVCAESCSDMIIRYDYES